MSDSQILDLIKSALDEVAPGLTADTPGLSFETEIGDLAIDSVSIMEMLGFIEEQVERTFDEDELAHVVTLGDLAAVIRKALAS